MMFRLGQPAVGVNPMMQLTRGMPFKVCRKEILWVAGLVGTSLDDVERNACQAATNTCMRA